MFKLVTNFDHWHNFYVSKNATQEFIDTSVNTSRANKRINLPPAVELARIEDQYEGRARLLMLAVDNPELLLTIEALLHQRCGNYLEDILSDNPDTRKIAARIIKVASQHIDQILATLRDRHIKKRNVIVELALVCTLVVIVSFFMNRINTDDIEQHDNIINNRIKTLATKEELDDKLDIKVKELDDKLNNQSRITSGTH